MTKKSTINDISKELNVSPSTVSRALNDHPRISEETKKLVKEAAAKAGYSVNGVASALRSGRTFTIGMIVPTADRSFFAGIMHGIEEVANKAGYNVMICQSNDNYESELEDIKALTRAQVDGIALSMAKRTTNFQHYEDLKKRGVPLIMFDRVLSNLDVSTVTVDDFGGAYKATSHLIKQGCQRIATFIGISPEINIYRERLRGYREALIAHNLPIREEYIIANELNLESGKKSAAQLWALPEPPDAIFCQSDLSALGAMQFFKANGVKMPQDVALVGFANEPFTAFIEPALTTVDQHPVEMGHSVAQLFLEQIDANGSFVPKHITLNAELIVRDSSLRVKN